MSDLTATNCGCGCNEVRSGCFNGGCSWIIILILLFSCCGNNSWGMGRSGCGDNNCWWIIILLLFFCCGNGCGDNDCGCGC